MNFFRKGGFFWHGFSIGHLQAAQLILRRQTIKDYYHEKDIFTYSSCVRLCSH